MLGRSAWFVGVLETVREVSPPGWWIGAGVIRAILSGSSGSAKRLRGSSRVMSMSLSSMAATSGESATARKQPASRWPGVRVID
jgi:hypothetical protein